MGKICIIKVGNIVAGLLDVIFLGRAKDVAGWIAWRFFKTHDCKCESRRIYLNELFGCPDGIKLN
jgi:hypothetical protein